MCMCSCIHINMYICIYMSGSPEVLGVPKRFDSRVVYHQNDDTLSRTSLRYLRKANLPMAVHSQLQGTFYCFHLLTITVTRTRTPCQTIVTISARGFTAVTPVVFL